MSSHWENLKRFDKITLEHLWLALPLVVTAAMGFRHKLRLLDFWWHLKIGEVIVETKSIPRADLFSFTVEGTTFVLQNWLTETVYYLVYWIGGLELLTVLNTAILLGALLPIYHLCWDSLRRVRATVFSVSFSVFALAAVYSNVRPQTVSFLFFAIFYWVLTRHSQNQKSFVWFLPPLMALWVNLHGAFVLGLGLICLFLFSEFIRMRVLAAPDALSKQQLRTLLLVLFFSFSATLLNPETYKVYDYVLTVARDPGSQIYVTEWQPPEIRQIGGIACFYGPFFLSLLILLYSRRRLSLTESLLFFGFAFFALTAIRNGIWFSLIVSPIVARGISCWDPWQEIRASWLPNKWFQKWSARVKGGTPRPVWNLAVAISMMAGVVISTPWVHPRISGTTIWEPETPVAAMDFIEKHRLQGNIFHPQVYGDYLIWRLWPDQKSFVDGRIHIFGPELVEDYLGVFNDSCWEKRLSPYDIRYLLLNKHEKVSRLTKSLRERASRSPGWNRIYEDDLCIILEKTQR
jgi:hypothetical protein